MSNPADLSVDELRARMLKKIAEVLRNNAGELAMIDAADCGNPVSETSEVALELQRRKKLAEFFEKDRKSVV